MNHALFTIVRTIASARAAALVLCALVATPALGQRSTPAQFLHPAGAAADQFGNAVAVSGDTMIVGAPQDDVGAQADQGSAHIYRWTGTGWTFEATITASDGVTLDRFGYAVAISGDTAIVGAYQDDVTATDQGSAYVFVRAPGGTTWTQQARLVASDAGTGDQFGVSVAIAGDTAIVGSHSDDVGANLNQGSTYVFVRSGAAWAQQAKLTASDGAANDFFGVAAAISGDTVLIGAYSDDNGANADQGSAYVFVRSGAAWTQQAKLTASDGATSDGFGIAVALSGDTALIGSYQDDVAAGGNAGSAYVFTRSGTVWTQQAQLTASDGAANDFFGNAVSLDGNTALVGAYQDDSGANANQGSAYVYVRAPGGTTWTQQAMLTSPDGAASDNFGSSVALAGDTAVVGVNNDDLGANTNQGSAWVFSRIGGAWIGPDFKLTASDGVANDLFGDSVAIDGDTAIVGANIDDGGAINQGSAYVFVRSGSAWTQQAQLVASDGAFNDQFGYSVALSGNTALVGAWADSVGANTSQGSAYVFVRSGTTWTQQAKLLASDGATSDFFGSSVSLDGDTALVGAYADDVGANAAQGSAYVFVRSGTTWTQQAKLLASDGATSDFFGSSVSLDGDTALIGAYGDDVGGNADHGSAYVFVRSGTTWTQQAQLLGGGGAVSDQFGIAVAIDGDSAIVGAYTDDVGANVDQGSAYVFTRSGTAWTQQAKLTASDGAALDAFGNSVAIDGDVAAIGAVLDDVGLVNQGSAYIFVRSGSVWTQVSKLTAPDGAASDQFGQSVALNAGSLIAGAMRDDSGANIDQGSAYLYGVALSDFVLAHNDSLDLAYPTLASAFLPAQTGQQISGTRAAWRSISNLDTAGRSLILWSDGDLRTPSTSIITLGGSSSLNVNLGDAIEIDGQARVSAAASADLYADSFLLGSRGILTARTNSSLTINAPIADLHGQTRLEQGAAVTFAGSATAIGPTTANLNASLTAGGALTNIDTLTLTAGTVSAPLFWNRAAANIFGTSAVFGNYTNEAGAITTIRSGTLFVFGSLTNSGTIIGTICSGCFREPPGLDVGGGLTLGPAANLAMPFTGAAVRVGGPFDCAIDSNVRYDMSLATLQMEGTGAEQTLEVMSADIGPSPLGLDRTLAGHYPVGVLRIGPSPSTVRLIDARDNDGQGQAACEAIYVNELRIDAGSRLINTSCRIYYTTLVNAGIVDVPANLVPIAAACPADFNGDTSVDDFDFFDFLNAFNANDISADFNGDTSVDDFDYFDFLNAFFTPC